MYEGMHAIYNGHEPGEATEPRQVLETSASVNLEQVDQEYGLPLATRLKNSVLQCPHDRSLAFLPNDSLENIMTRENIEECLKKSENPILRSRCSDIMEFVCGLERPSASGILAVLLLIEDPQLIVDFMEEGISDHDLPLSLRDNERSHLTQYCLDRKVEGSLLPIKRFDQWKSVQRFAFFNHQWWVKLPVFERSPGKSLDAHPVIRLHKSTILPWVEHKQVVDHQNSNVIRVRIHDAHHDFGPETNKAFAVKCLKSDVVAFQLEVKALLKIKSRPHLVELLTTYEYQDHYHLMFRWAEGGNLADLWKEHVREPTMDHGLICWFAEQCHGLADGLDGIHDTKLSQKEVEVIQGSPISSLSTKVTPLPQYLTVKQVGVNRHPLPDGDCGRHGDIKPENVLWFSQDPNRFGRGELKISDFGLTTFHSMLTTKVSPMGIAVTQTYMAPEYDLNEDLSRSFDIWSLGCTFLEFITWILLGADGLEEFSALRLQETGSRKTFYCDNFYKIIREEHKTRAEVKQSVETWIFELKRTTDCSPFLAEFLDFIQQYMMVVDKSKRNGIRQVTTWLQLRYEICLQDQAFAVGPAQSQGSVLDGGDRKRKHSSDRNDENTSKRRTRRSV